MSGTIADVAVFVQVAGGDGTAGWLLGVVSDLKLSHPPPIATVPPGIGNNLPFAFGWGKKNPGTNPESVLKFLEQVMEAKEMEIDSWHILMRMKSAPKEGYCDLIAHLKFPHSLHAFNVGTIFTKMQNQDEIPVEPETESSTFVSADEADDWSDYKDSDIILQHYGIWEEDAAKSIRNVLWPSKKTDSSNRQIRTLDLYITAIRYGNGLFKSVNLLITAIRNGIFEWKSQRSKDGEEEEERSRIDLPLAGITKQKKESISDRGQCPPSVRQNAIKNLQGKVEYYLRLEKSMCYLGFQLLVQGLKG
ncbi:hypothetical protein L2E82_51427 [Cichorium intybus]|nr:hypothetical protein L2E82_51427 [Cichorium intybus]